LIVDGPDFTLPPFSLESVVDWRTGDKHWKAGVEWQSVCGESGSTYDECVLVGATSGTVTGSPVPFPEPSPKASTASRQIFGATPFTIFAEIDCSAVGFYDDSTELVVQRLERTEHRELESNAVVTDTELNGNLVTLQQAATIVTGAATCVEVALGLLEAAFASCYSGTGVLHVPAELIPLLNREFLLEQDGTKLHTTNGNRVVVGTGYPGSAPDGTVAANVRWMYMTSPIFGYRSEVRTFERETTLNRSVNTVKAIAERTYVLGYDCCLVAVPVSLTCG
jgi:hypothetical protein